MVDTMRDRLQEVAKAWESRRNGTDRYELIDNILREMHSPTEGMLDATMEGKEAFGPPEGLTEAASKRTRERFRRAATSNWQNMLGHILDGGK